MSGGWPLVALGAAMVIGEGVRLWRGTASPQPSSGREGRPRLFWASVSLRILAVVAGLASIIIGLSR